MDVSIQLFISYPSADAGRPFLFGWVAQFFGIGIIGPLYFFLHYATSQISNFKALDNRLTNFAYTRTVLPVMIAGFYVPLFISHFHPDLSVRHAGNWIWQIYPVWVSGLQFLLVRTIVPSTIQHDRIYAPTRDVSTIRFTVGTFVALSAAVWLYVFSMSPFSPMTIFIPHPAVPQTSWIVAIRTFVQYDHLFCWSSALLWLGYLFADLKHAGMVTQSWLKIVATAALTTLLLGPGAAVGLGWLWRENILLTKRHKSAIVKR